MRIDVRTDAVPGAGAEGNVAERMSSVFRHEALRIEFVWLRKVLRVHVYVLYADDDRATARQHHIRCNEKQQDGGVNCL
jgi:hypothetical protein